MTAYLADTHIALWAWRSPEKLSPSQREVLQYAEDPVFLSIVSIWEMAIKAGKGKLQVPTPLTETFLDRGYLLLPLDVHHAEAVRDLPHHHGDPFDRLLIAQAQTDGLTILTQDRSFGQYEVATA